MSRSQLRREDDVPNQVLLVFQVLPRHDFRRTELSEQHIVCPNTKNHSMTCGLSIVPSLFLEKTMMTATWIGIKEVYSFHLNKHTAFLDVAGKTTNTRPICWGCKKNLLIALSARWDKICGLKGPNRTTKNVWKFSRNSQVFGAVNPKFWLQWGARLPKNRYAEDSPYCQISKTSSFSLAFDRIRKP